jgi:hypothetical protein
LRRPLARWLLPRGKKLLLKFRTVISNRTQDDVRFSVLANGKELWSETKTAFLAPDSPEARPQDNLLPGKDPFSDQALDLSAYAGQSFKLTLRINALGNNMYGWANWIEPEIVEAK